jgi:hypothetical protein
MSEESNLKEALLRQMDQESDERHQDGTKSIEEIIARDMVRIKRLKWITASSWVLVVLCFIPAAFLEYAEESGVLTTNELVFLNSLALILRALLLIAIVLTVSLYMRSRTLTIHRIQARLANIEELLKKMSHDKQTADRS